MSSKIKILLLSCLAPLLLSCEKGNVDKEIVTFDNFWFCQYTPDTISIGKVQIEFLDDADSSEGNAGYETGFCIAVYNTNEEGKKTLVNPHVAHVYYNGEINKDNKYIVTNKNGNVNVEVSLVVNPDAENSLYNFSIEVMEEGQNLDKLIVGDEDINIFQTKFTNHSVGNYCIKKDSKPNPLKEGLITGISIFFIILFVWVLVVRNLFFPRIKVNQLQFEGPGAFFGVFSVKGCYQVILTNNTRKKQGLLNQILVGKKMYIYNDIWTEDVVFKHFSSDSVSATVSGTWYCESYQLSKFNVYKIYDTAKKDDKGKVTPM